MELYFITLIQYFLSDNLLAKMLYGKVPDGSRAKDSMSSREVWAHFVRNELCMKMKYLQKICYSNLSRFFYSVFCLPM